MTIRKKPLVWNWPPVPGRSGTPAQQFQAYIAEANMQSSDQIAEIIGDQPADNAQVTAEFQPDPNAIEGSADDEINVAAENSAENQLIGENESPAVDTPAQLPDSAEKEEERISPLVGPVTPPGNPGDMIYPPQMELAKAYIPYQTYGTTYNPREALEKGTLFPALYRPYPY